MRRTGLVPPISIVQYASMAAMRIIAKTKTRAKDPGAELSVPEAALLLLVWQEPSDRALAGWAPYPGFRPHRMSGESLARWFRGQLQRTPA